MIDGAQVFRTNLFVNAIFQVLQRILLLPGRDKSILVFSKDGFDLRKKLEHKMKTEKRGGKHRYGRKNTLTRVTSN